MNPKLVKFSVELQTGEKVESKNENRAFSSIGKYFFNFYSTLPIALPVEKE